MSSSKNIEFEQTSFLSKSNSAFIEDMYQKFIEKDPNLPESWKSYFETLGDDFDLIIKEIKPKNLLSIHIDNQVARQ